MNSAGAVHIAGTLPDGNTKQPVAVNFQIQSDGSSGSTSAMGPGGQLTRVGGITYVKASVAFYIANQITPANAVKVANR
jgi:hypothetical protein